VLEYYNAHRSEAEQHAQYAADIARSATQREYAAARVTRGYLAFQRSEYTLAVTCTQDASRIARSADHEAIALRSEVIAAAVGLATGADGARDRLIAGIRAALANDLDELASTGYSNLANLDVEQRRISAAEDVLESSLAHTVERDIPICNHWQTGVRSRARLLQGRWTASSEDAAQVLDKSGMPLAKLWPHIVMGLIGLRRDCTDGGHFDQAWQLAESLDEPLRRIPVLSALAERQWLTGRTDERVDVGAPEAVRRYAGEAAAAWGVGDLAVWQRRLGRLDSEVPGVALPYQMTLSGRHLDAADWWHRCGATYDEAMALADADDPTSRTRAVERLDLLGATAVADSIRLRLRQDGIANVPQRPRTSTLANPSGLTNRQLDVAKLVARGLTNAEIASRLYISPKTADHHVSAVLAKLGLPSRRDVVVQARELGL
jgi:DNA-binding CsgD family transcriptional regulator